MIDPQVEKKRKRVLTLLTVAGILLFSAILYAFWYSPKLGELKDLRDELSRKQDEISDEVMKQTTAVNVTDDELGRWKRKIEELNRRLPDREDFENLLYDIGKMARKMGLQDFKLTVETDEEEEGKGEREVTSSKQISVAKRKKEEAKKKRVEDGLPVNAAILRINFSSGYREMAYFIEGLTKNLRAMSLDEIEVGRNGDRMVAQITVKAYYRESYERKGQ